MKSIMEQASSVIKAVEKAWQQAGHPQEFSIKVFEKEEKNFFGITTKPAKIAFFFNERTVKQHQAQPTKKFTKKHPQEKNNTGTQKPPRVRPLEHNKKAPQKTSAKPAPKKNNAPVEKRASIIVKTPNVASTMIDKAADKKKEAPILWTPEMITFAKQWTTQTLSLLGFNGASFTADVNRYHLKIHFDKQVTANTQSERALFRNCAHLVMQTVRNNFKKKLKGFKVILNSPITVNTNG